VPTEHVMGLPVSVHAPGAHTAAVDAVFAWLREVDARFSPFRADSEISRIDRGELDVVDAHPDVREVLARCERLRAASGGYFDARAGGSLDPCGLVKGWAVDRAGALLAAAGATRFCIDAGGDVLVRGGPWRVGVRHPLRADALCAALALSDGAVATSGAYERGAHIVDPVAGGAPRGALSVTVVGRSLATADACATAAFAMGARGPAWIARLRACEAMTVLEGGRVLCTAGFGRHRLPLSRAG
jgi:thiamine biosynthesis lipoprotein